MDEQEAKEFLQRRGYKVKKGRILGDPVVILNE